MGLETVLINAGPWLEVPPVGYGGIENVVATLVPALRAAGLRVILATVGTSTIACDERITTYPDGRFADLTRPYNEVAGIPHSHVMEVMADLRTRSDVDVVHDHQEVVGPSLLAAAGGEIPPALHTLHWDTNRHRRFYDVIDGRGRVWFNGVSAAQLAAAGPNVQSQSLGHVHLAATEVASEPAGARGDHLLVLGRICAIKGQDVAASLGRQLGIPVFLAGPVGGHENARHLADALADPASPAHRNADVAFFRSAVEPLLDDTVQWIGTIGGAEKDRLLRTARALLMPIRWSEPGATVVVEALAAGTPVIGTSLGALPELVDQGQTGWLVDDPAMFPAAVADLDAIDPQQCLDVARRRFTPERMAAAYIDRYEQLLWRTSTGAERSLGRGQNRRTAPMT